MNIKTFAAAAAAMLAVAGPATAETLVLDLTHPTPTFQPMEGDPMKPDLARPWLSSIPIPSFGQQAVLSIGRFPTNQGHFDLGTLVIPEHHGTHLDSPGHYINNEDTQAPGNPAGPDRQLVHQLDGKDLTGPVVMVDISARVQAELDRNGGRPSPDTGVTDFSEASGNVVTAADIEAVADRIGDGVWIVFATGWSRFYFEGMDFAGDPYVNGFNFPGLSKAAIDKIMEIEDTRGVRINGIMSDIISIESGEGSRGDDENFTNAFYGHVMGLQRGWKFVENGANLDLLAMADTGQCTLVVGAPKHVRGTGGPSRVFAMCGQ